MESTLRLGTCAVLGALILGVAGCSGRQGNFEEVSGKVVFADGKPLKSGMINFQAVDKDNPEAFMAEIQSNGTFNVTGGVRPGKYKVYLSPPETGDVVPEGEGGGEKGPPQFAAPENYQDPEASGWTAEIKEDSKEPLTFTIGSR